MSPSNDNEDVQLDRVFSLMPREKIKLNLLLDIPQKQDIEEKCHEYKLVIRYRDMYTNLYCQSFDIVLCFKQDNPLFTMYLNIEQIPEQILPNIA